MTLIIICSILVISSLDNPQYWLNINMQEAIISTGWSEMETGCQCHQFGIQKSTKVLNERILSYYLPQQTKLQSIYDFI